MAPPSHRFLIVAPHVDESRRVKAVKIFIAATAVALLLGSAMVSAMAADKDAREAPFGKLAISDQAMAQLRGGKEAVSQTATNSGSCVLCSVDGTATVNGGAFGNAAGLIVVIQNVGANVILQSATTVTVTVH
jgi:hypothetical protein